MGRDRKIGERYPSGKLKPQKNSLKPTGEPLSGTLYQRLKQHGKQLAVDPRILTELGRLNWFGELTLAQTAAGFRVAEIYGRFERFKKKRRSVASPSYQSGSGEADIAEELLGEAARQELERKILDAQKAFVGLQNEIGAAMRATIEQLCVEDRAVNPLSYDQVRETLQHLAQVFKISNAAAPAAPAHQPSRPQARRGSIPLHFNAHEAAASTPGPDQQQARSSPAKPNLDRIFWIQVARKIAPHLTEAQLGEAFDIQQALKHREIFRRAKARKPSNIIPFG